MYHLTAQDEAVATAKPAQSAFYKDPISSFDPGDAKASDVVNLLNEQFSNLQFSAEPTTNRIYGRVSKSQIDDIERFVDELAKVAAEHRHQQEKLRREELDKEAVIREREEDVLREQAAEKQALQEARNAEAGMSAVDAGLAFSQPFGSRMAAAQLRNAELQLQKLRATHGPNHPSIRNGELEVEAIKHLQKPQFHLFDRFRFTGSSQEMAQSATQQPAQLVEILRQLRPDLDVQIEGFDEGLVVFRGSEESVAEAERVIKALQDVTRSSDPATLQRQYEKSERSAANIAEQLREAKSGTSPDGKRIDELREHLANAVQMAFELRLQLQQYQLERAEADLMTARARLILREEIAEQIIERRISELENKDNLAWAPATPRETINEQADTGTRKIEDAEVLRRGTNQVQGQFGDDKANWIAELKKHRLDQEQLIREVNDLREKLKAATRVSFGKPRQTSRSGIAYSESGFRIVEPRSPSKPAAKPLTADAADWERVFGIKLGAGADLSDAGTRYRGGVQVEAVFINTPAEKAGIRAGDILVGIDVWETTSPENFAFFFNEITQPPRKDTVKFYLLRDDETVWGNMVVPKLPATSDSTSRPPSSNTEKSEKQPSKFGF
jgi:hypothetical protein